MNIYLKKIKIFIKECRRVLKVTRKPTKEEFVAIVKITSLGIGLIGTTGFLLYILKHLLFPGM